MIATLKRTVNKNMLFYSTEKDLSSEDIEVDLESNVMAESKQNVSQSYIIICHIHGC